MITIKLNSNWLELDYIIEVPWDDICCNLALYKWNWTELNCQFLKILSTQEISLTLLQGFQTLKIHFNAKPVVQTDCEAIYEESDEKKEKVFLY